MKQKSTTWIKIAKDKIVFVEYEAIWLNDDIYAVTNPNVYPNILSPESSFTFKRNLVVHNLDSL